MGHPPLLPSPPPTSSSHLAPNHQIKSDIIQFGFPSPPCHEPGSPGAAVKKINSSFIKYKKYRCKSNHNICPRNVSINSMPAICCEKTLRIVYNNVYVQVKAAVIKEETLMWSAFARQSHCCFFLWRELFVQFLSISNPYKNFV